MEQAPGVEQGLEIMNLAAGSTPTSVVPLRMWNMDTAGMLAR